MMRANQSVGKMKLPLDAIQHRRQKEARMRGQPNRKNEYFPVCVRSCLRIWSRETGSAVSSRVSLLISILRLNLGLTYGITPDFRGGVHLFI